MPYTVKLYDKDLQLLRSLTDVVSVTARCFSNAATTATVVLPFDKEIVADLQIASNLAIYRGATKICDGRAISRDFSRNEAAIEILGHEDRLGRMKTPHNWIGWNGMDLADMARDVLNRFRFSRFTSQEDWQSSVEKQNVDLTTEPGSVMLARKPYKNGEQFFESGYIVVRLDLGEKAIKGRLNRWVRWTERAGDPTRITIQSRSADSLQDLVVVPWGPELTAVNVDSEKANETRGVLVADNGRYVEIRVNLYTEDTTSPDNSKEPAYYGRTPILDGIEVIWREPGEVVVEGEIPESTGVIVTDGRWNRVTHLKAIRDECERAGWRFRVRHEEGAGKVVLDLAPSLETWEADKNLPPPFSKDRTNEVLIRTGENATVSVQSERDDQYANVLHCWGAGSGIDRIYIRVLDQAAIDARGGEEIEADFEFDTDNMAELESKGLEELARRTVITSDYVVELHDMSAWPILLVGDRVKVANPRHGRVDSLLITEQTFEYSARRDTVRLALGGATLMGAIESMIVSSRRLPRETMDPPPPPPTNLVAIPVIGGIKLQWAGLGERWEIWHTQEVDGSNNPINFKLLDVRYRTEYDHVGAEFGPVHYYGVRTLLGDRASDFTYTAGIANRQIQPEEIAGEVFNIIPSSDPPPATGSLESLWDMDITTGVTFASPPTITFRYPVVQATDFMRIHVGAPTSAYVQMRDMDSGNWINVAGSAANRKNLSAGWNIIQFDGKKMYYGREFRVVLTNAVTVNELKFWRIVLADEILAQVMTLTGSLKIVAGDGAVTIDQNGVKAMSGNEVTFDLDISGSAWFGGDVQARSFILPVRPA